MAGWSNSPVQGWKKSSTPTPKKSSPWQAAQSAGSAIMKDAPRTGTYDGGLDYGGMLAGSDAQYNADQNDLSRQLYFNDANTKFEMDYQNEMARLSGQSLDNRGNQYANDANNINRSIGYYQGDSALDQLGNQLDRNVLERQRDYTNPALNDIAMQMYDVDIQGAERGKQFSQHELNLNNLGFDVDAGGNARDRGTLQQMHGYQNQRFGLEGQDFTQQGQEAEFRSQQALRDAESSAVARGATNSSGYRTDISEIDTILGFDKSRIGRGQQELGIRTQEESAQFNNDMGELQDQLSRINIGRDKAKLDYDQQQTSLTDTITKLGLSKRGQGVEHAERQAQLNDELARNGITSERERRDLAEQISQAEDGLENISFLSKQLGIDRQELEYRTQYALDQLGISNHVTTNQIYAAMRDLQAGRFNEYSQYLGDIYRYGGIGG